MVAKCNPAYPNNVNRTLCQNPGHDVDHATMVPVTDLTTNEVYRNKYCFYCSKTETHTQLVPWMPAIANDQEIDPTHKTFLNELKAQHGNIIFYGPRYLSANKCDLYRPTYNISSCNVTGLWLVYNQTIETACESFTDPFNFTYKNYFCYLCNVAKHLPVEEWICKKSNNTSGHTSITPPFSAILDVSVLDRDTSKEALTCTRDQFPDYKFVSKFISLVVNLKLLCSALVGYSWFIQ